MQDYDVSIPHRQSKNLTGFFFIHLLANVSIPHRQSKNVVMRKNTVVFIKVSIPHRQSKNGQDITLAGTCIRCFNSS